MHRTFALLLAFLLGPIACRSAESVQTKSDERQIAEAVSPLPEQLRDGAAVRGYRGSTALVHLREGTNPMICLADDPTDDRWHVACYHRDLEPFMSRGRELRMEGKDRAAIDRIRRAEIEAGKLPMPEHPSALYSLTGPEGSFDPETGRPEGAKGGLYVVYVPYATQETTGLPTEPSRERPWLMFPGSPWAHIMISR